MQSQTLSFPKYPAIKEVSFDDLCKRASRWSERIANRAYEFFAASGFTNGHDREDWLKAERELLKPVALGFLDATDEVILTANVSGFDAKELNIYVNGSHLVIEGKHERAVLKNEKERETVRDESRQIYRTIQLPASVVAKNAQAELKNGVLELKLPKAERAQQITAAAA